MEPAITKHIECTPGVCGGRPRIAGSRIRVSHVVLMTEQGQSPDEIVAGYPHLTLADVHAALVFYHDNRDDIDREIAESDDLIGAIRKAENRADTDANPVSS